MFMSQVPLGDKPYSLHYYACGWIICNYGNTVCVYIAFYSIRSLAVHVFQYKHTCTHTNTHTLRVRGENGSLLSEQMSPDATLEDLEKPGIDDEPVPIKLRSGVSCSPCCTRNVHTCTYIRTACSWDNHFHMRNEGSTRQHMPVIHIHVRMYGSIVSLALRVASASCTCEHYMWLSVAHTAMPVTFVLGPLAMWGDCQDLAWKWPPRAHTTYLEDVTWQPHMMLAHVHDTQHMTHVCNRCFFFIFCLFLHVRVDFRCFYPFQQVF